MRRIKVLTATGAVALPMILMGASVPAQASTAREAAYHKPQVAFVGHARTFGGKASVLAVYRCWGGNEGTHLWVSLKQGGGIKGKSLAELSKLEGTSEIARAWYDTNVVEPSR